MIVCCCKDKACVWVFCFASVILSKRVIPNYVIAIFYKFDYMNDLVLEPQKPSGFRFSGIIMGLCMFSIWPLIGYFKHESMPLIIEVVWLLLCCLFVFILKMPLKLTFSQLTGKLTYDFINGYGVHQTKTVDFNKPLHYEYKYTAEGSRRYKWRLQAFNSYLRNRIQVDAIKSEKFFKKEQLDELDAAIMKFKHS
jgi:hypothetical protein